MSDKLNPLVHPDLTKLLQRWVRETGRQTPSTPTQGRYLCGRWLRVRQLQAQISSAQIQELTGIDSSTLSLLRHGLPADLQPQMNWSAFAYLLSRSHADNVLVREAVDVLQGRLPEPSPTLLQQIHADFAKLQFMVELPPMIVFDTTLRDGLEAMSVNKLNLPQRIEVAGQLKKLGVDVIECGTPAFSEDGDKAVRSIAKLFGTADGPIIAAAARATRGDIKEAWDAVQKAKRPRLHVFLPTSDLLIEAQLRSTREAVLEQVREMVTYARSLCDDIQFSAVDATRSDREFLRQIVAIAIEAGATTINLPDTVGQAMPDEYRELFADILQTVPDADLVTLSAHCHNDLELAVANSLAAIAGGARQVECTVIGIGERAGNASLEAIVMSLLLRSDYYEGLAVRVKPEEFAFTSRLVSDYTGKPLPPIVDAAAYHQKNYLDREGREVTSDLYSIIQPEQVGLHHAVLDSKSRYKAFRERVKELGYDLDFEQACNVYVRFWALANQRKVVSDQDLVELISWPSPEPPEVFRLTTCTVISGVNAPVGATVVMFGPSGKLITTNSDGNGPLDALFKAINKAVVQFGVLQPGESVDYKFEASNPKVDDAAEVYVHLRVLSAKTADVAGIAAEEVFEGVGVDTDTVAAAAYAYMMAINSLLQTRLQYLR